MTSDFLKRNIFSLAALAVLLVFAVGSVDTNNSHSSSSGAPPASTVEPSVSTPTVTHSSVNIGDIGVLSSGGASTIIVASDKAAEDELTKAAVANDQEGVANLVVSGRAFMVQSGTKVRKLDTTFSLGFLPTGAHVRILEGPYYGRDGYVPHEWVVPATSANSVAPESTVRATKKTPTKPMRSPSPKRKQ